ncbi:hypothetical protein [Gudongella sp. SC589]|uniref:hypothetical protein n=1 Tax=Gudongella sp. SC589 TaxID=3385990 RepID=UPI003904B80A
MVEFESGMTVADAIRSAGLSTDQGTIVMVDRKVLSKEELFQVVENDTDIKVMILVSGG